MSNIEHIFSIDDTCLVDPKSIMNNKTHVLGVINSIFYFFKNKNINRYGLFLEI